jgi:single-strand DNA-binding protein
MTTQVSKPKPVAGRKQPTTMPGSTTLPASTEGHRNEVVICGRLSAAAVMKELPSGDEIVNWRLVVDRPAADGSRKVDVVDCTTFGARARRQAFGWKEGDVIEVVGSLRRRFWRGAGGLQSRCEVEVDTATRRTTAGGKRRAAAAALSRPRTPA